MSQNDLILEHLKSGKSITPLEALKLFGCFRLSGRILELKRDGHDIITNMVKNYDTGKTYAEYHIRTIRA